MLELSEPILLALIAGVMSIAAIVVKHMLDTHSRRIDQNEAEVQTLKALTTDVIRWSFALEDHVYQGKPPPPPPRPLSLIDFFTLELIDKH